MINANDGGATVSFDGGSSWSTQDNQPTAQFYRVAVDAQFPYNLYAGQQDNSAIAVASRNSDANLGEQDWHSVAGCETAYLAFDRNDPRHIFGGCYQGGISAYDARTRQQHSISAYPANRFGIQPADMKFRFNWNAPLIASLHDPTVLYHAAEVVLRSQDRGQSWTVISPDLTRNDATKQREGGGPITNETAGGENYNTIMYLAQSPHSRDVLWTGSDDGRVHLTRDGGASWVNVTPRNMPEGIVNSIEISPHDAGTAYLAFTRNKFADLRPVIYCTSNFGKTWQQLPTLGIHDQAFVRVVREDPKVAGLLYAGTERGLHISFDAGRHWNQFETNFPRDVPITDLQIHANDLIIATSGRAFWILDDLGTLQQSKGKFPTQAIALYAPKPTVLFGDYLKPTADEDKDKPKLAGDNLSGGVAIDYYLPHALDPEPDEKDPKAGDELVLTVRNAAGELMRRYSSKKDATFEKFAGGPKPSPRLPVKAGLNRFVWDFRGEGLPAVEGLFTMGSYAGPRLAPGSYTIALELGEQHHQVPVELRADPRLEAKPEDFAAQQTALREVTTLYTELAHALRKVRAIEQQLAGHAKLLKGHEGRDALREQAEKVRKAFVDWQDTVAQTKQKTWQDVINFPNHLNAQLLFLKDEFDAHHPTPRQGALQRLADLAVVWAERKAALQRLLDGDLASYQESFRGAGAPAIIVPNVTPSEQVGSRRGNTSLTTR